CLSFDGCGTPFFFQLFSTSKRIDLDTFKRFSVSLIDKPLTTSSHAFRKFSSLKPRHFFLKDRRAKGAPILYIYMYKISGSGRDSKRHPGEAAAVKMSATLPMMATLPMISIKTTVR